MAGQSSVPHVLGRLRPSALARAGQQRGKVLRVVPGILYGSRSPSRRRGPTAPSWRIAEPHERLWPCTRRQPTSHHSKSSSTEATLLPAAIFEALSRRSGV